MSKGINYDDWPGHRSAMDARFLNLQIDQLIRQVNQLRGQLAKVEAEDTQLRVILAKVEAEELAQAIAIVAAHDAAMATRDDYGTGQK